MTKASLVRLAEFAWSVPPFKNKQIQIEYFGTEDCPAVSILSARFGRDLLCYPARGEAWGVFTRVGFGYSS